VFYFLTLPEMPDDGVRRFTVSVAHMAMVEDYEGVASRITLSTGRVLFAGVSYKSLISQMEAIRWPSS
jgi:hypothetical protein